MPYIKQQDREIFKESIDNIVAEINRCIPTVKESYILQFINIFFVSVFLDSSTNFNKNVEKLIELISLDPTARCGQVNYIISKILIDSYSNNMRYYDINNIIGTLEMVKRDFPYNRLTDYARVQIMGVLECIKLEFYRKIAAPYEDIKEKENGKV